MKKKLFLIFLSLMLVLNCMGCTNNQDSPESDKEAAKEASSKSNINLDTESIEDETNVVRWVRGHSGNAMMSLARANGYLDEYGIEVEEIPMQTTKDSFAALSSGKVDVISNAGTGLPLQYIASGEDVVIFGGHMVAGSVKLIGPPDAKFDGIEDIVGKTVAGTGPHGFQYSGPLLDLGYDPANDVDWVEMETADTIAAVIRGEVDFGSVGTSMTQRIYELEKEGVLSVVADSNELVENYSCCRMETSGEFIRKNPNTAKKLLKALIRGQKDFEENPERAVELIAEELDSPKDFVAAYAYDPGYIIHVDPLYNSCIRAWEWFDEMGLLDENAKNMDLRDSVNIDLYKEALDEVIEEVGHEDPEYWDGVLKYFEENNSRYFD